MTRREELRRELVKVLDDHLRDWGDDATSAGYADALLPLVDRLCAEAAAEALNEAAADWPEAYASSVYDWLQDRAAALTETKDTDRD